MEGLRIQTHGPLSPIMSNLECHYPHFPDKKIKAQIAVFPEQARSQNHSSSLLCHKAKKALYLYISLFLEANALSLQGLTGTPACPIPISLSIFTGCCWQYAVEFARNEARVGNRSRPHLLPGPSFPKQSVGICEVCTLVGREGCG